MSNLFALQAEIIGREFTKKVRDYELESRLKANLCGVLGIFGAFVWRFWCFHVSN